MLSFKTVCLLIIVVFPAFVNSIPKSKTVFKIRMVSWPCLWHLFSFIDKYGLYEATSVPSAKPSILEVSVGETAKLHCPSNDDNHRFQFWQLQSDHILGPGNKIDERKYKYDVLSGALYIKGVSLNERGIYTCYCKHLYNTTYSAKSIMLEVKSDWTQLWENDEVNLFRLGVLVVIGTLIVMVMYVLYNNIRRDQLMQFKEFTDENMLDEAPSRRASYSSPKIVGLFGEEEREEEFVFLQAVEEANIELRKTPWSLNATIMKIIPYDSFLLSRELCRRLKEEPYAAIFGPDYFDLTNTIKSLTKAKKIPQIDTRWDTTWLASGSDVYINLFPNSTLFEQAICDFLKDMDWETFTLIYDGPESLVVMQEVLKEKMGRSKYDRPAVVMKELPDSIEEYKPFLKQIKNSSETHIMLHCNPETTIIVLEKAKEVDLLGPYQSFFIPSFDTHTIDFRNILPEDKDSQSNITTLRLISPDNAHLQANLQKYTKKLASDPSWNISITANTIKTDTALMRDAVMLFTEALKDMSRTNFSTSTVDCYSQYSYWEFGAPLMEKMKSITFEGFSGEMNHDPNGRRNRFKIDYLEANRDGFRTLASWNPLSGVKHYRNVSQMSQESSMTLANKTLTVVTKIVAPYLIKIDNESLTGNDQYEGFCKDLLDRLAENLNFKYVLKIPESTVIGELNKETGRYSGLIGELRELRADLAICDFTITPERKKAVDFTAPFMSLGVGILYTVAPAKESSYFSFLDPFDITVWMYLATAYLSLSIALYIVARCTPFEWEGAHPCDDDPEELENAWNLKNCLWLAMGSVLQQGCDILPKATSARITAGSWWFFSLIITSTYTANLAAFLTTQRMESPIKSAQDLANQDQVKYGCMRDGATADFFRTSNDTLYQRMYANMESANPSVFCESNEKGVERVLRSKHKYAFFMESSSIDYQKKLDCDLAQIGDLLDSKFYGIALPLGSRYRDLLTTQILNLKENRVVDELKEKWWRNKDNITCEEEVDEDKDKLGVGNVGGVFLLLILGCVLSFCVSILEFLWNVRKVAVREKIHLSEAFWLELKFAFKLLQTTKPVRHTPQGEPLGTPLSVSQIGFINKN